MCYETNVYLFDITFFCLFVILTGLDFLDFKLRIYISTCLSIDVYRVRNWKEEFHRFTIFLQDHVNNSILRFECDT